MPSDLLHLTAHVTKAEGGYVVVFNARAFVAATFGEAMAKLREWMNVPDEAPAA